MPLWIDATAWRSIGSSMVIAVGMAGAPPTGPREHRDVKPENAARARRLVEHVLAFCLKRVLRLLDDLDARGGSGQALTMASEKVERVLELAAELTADEREEVAAKLLALPSPADRAEHDRAWDDEIERRDADFDAGKPGLSLDAVMAMSDAARAARATSR